VERMAFAFRVAPGQEDDIRTVAASIRAAEPDFVRSRRAMGLSRLSAWLQATPEGFLVLLLTEGEDLQGYFEQALVDRGFDEWLREKLVEWTGSDLELSAVYRYPQSEEMFHWCDGTET